MSNSLIELQAQTASCLVCCVLLCSQFQYLCCELSILLFYHGSHRCSWCNHDFLQTMSELVEAIGAKFLPHCEPIMSRCVDRSQNALNSFEALVEEVESEKVRRINRAKMSLPLLAVCSRQCVHLCNTANASPSHPPPSPRNNTPSQAIVDRIVSSLDLIAGEVSANYACQHVFLLLQL